MNIHHHCGKNELPSWRQDKDFNKQFVVITYIYPLVTGNLLSVTLGHLWVQIRFEDAAADGPTCFYKQSSRGIAVKRLFQVQNSVTFAKLERMIFVTTLALQSAPPLSRLFTSWKE